MKLLREVFAVWPWPRDPYYKDVFGYSQCALAWLMLSQILNLIAIIIQLARHYRA